MLDGSITVNSTEGIGSTFTVGIATGEIAEQNLVDYESISVSKRTLCEPIVGQSTELARHVLIVDDRRDIQYLSQ